MVFLFYAVALVMVLSAVAVVLHRNPMYSALWLILNMVGVAIIFAFLEAHFLAVVQLIVYAGAIMVLVLFVIMLLNFKHEDYRSKNLPLWMLSFCSLGIFLYFFVPLLANSFASLNNQNQSGARLEGTVRAIGEALFTKYVFTFEAASLLIMAALVGSVMMGSRMIHKREE